MGDYATLQADIPNWLEDHSAEIIANVPTIIQNAETRIALDLASRKFNWTASGVISVGAPNYPVPDDLRAMLDFRLIDGAGNSITLNERMYDWVKVYWPNENETGTPKYYAIDDDDSFIVAPTPDIPYQYTLRYRRKLPALSVSNPTNWLTEQAYSFLLYACLQQGARFLLSDDKDTLAASYEEEYQKLLAGLSGSEARALRDDNRAPTMLQSNVG